MVVVIVVLSFSSCVLISLYHVFWFGDFVIGVGCFVGWFVGVVVGVFVGSVVGLCVGDFCAKLLKTGRFRGKIALFFTLSSGTLRYAESENWVVLSLKIGWKYPVSLEKYGTKHTKIGS